jgi:threonine/homoserine/homoserine lactone efflux protein
MDIHNYFLFVCASIVLCAVPGPDMILLLTRSIAQGNRAGLMTALGINAGAYFHLTAAAVGISAIIAASAFAFSIVKFAGAAYLIYLGVRTLRSKVGILQIASEKQFATSQWSYFWQGFLSDVLNPKVAFFYLAFLPQFVTPAGNATKQLILLGVTANVIGICSSMLIVFFAAALTERLREDIRVSAFLGKALGGVFVFLGLRLAGEKML